MSIADKASSLVTAVRNFGTAVDTKTDNTNTGKEPTIVGTSVADFYSGAKTWVSFAGTARAVTLTGLSTATSTAIAATDTILIALGKAQAQIDTKAASSHNHSGVYQPLDNDLTAIAALAGTSGFLKKTATDTWALDTNVYLTGNQTVTLSGDATGSGSTSIAVTLANSGVTAGTYNNNASSVIPFTVDSKGRITGIGTAVTITPAFSSVTGKPTTLAGYGITDASPLAGSSSIATVGTITTGTWNAGIISPTYGGTGVNNGTRTLTVTTNSGTVAFIGSSTVLTINGSASVSGTNTGDQTITLTGDATGSGTGSFAVTLANSGVTAGTYNSSATAHTPFTVDAKGRVTGTGAAVTITPAWSSITSEPTTVAGFGITDAFTTAGGALTGPLLVNGASQISGSASAEVISYTGGTTQYGISLKPTSAGATTVINFFNSAGTSVGNISQTDTAVAFTGNAATASALAATRQIAGVSFNGTADIAIPFANLSSKPTTLAGYGITDGVNKTGDTMTGALTAKTFRETRSAMAAVNIDMSTGGIFTKTIAGATTFTVSNVPAAGTSGSFMLDLTNGGSASITWWAGVKWAGGTAPTLTAAGRDVLGFFTHDGGTTWTGLLLGKDVK